MRIFRSISISKSVLCLDFFFKFFEFARCFEKGGHYSLSLNSSSENVLTTVSMVIRDGDHSFIVDFLLGGITMRTRRISRAKIWV